MKTLVLIDLSSIAYPIYMMAGGQTDPNYVSQQIVTRVHALAGTSRHVAICCEGRGSFRRDLDPTYKAQRPEKDEVLIYQIEEAKTALEAEGFPVWSARGYEADDIIASAVARAIAHREVEGCEVLVVTGDKDLLQLVGEGVHVKSTKNGDVLDIEGVKAKMGVSPAQIVDYLSLVGDTSDNVVGAKGIGPKTAADLLARFGSIDGIYAAIAQGTPFKASSLASLQEFQARRALVKQLITLRPDASIAFDAILQERPMPSLIEPEPTPSEPNAQPGPIDVTDPKPTAIARVPDVLAPAPAEFERQLEPRSYDQARLLSEDMAKSRMFSGYGTPHQVLSTVLIGRELGLPAMASLRGIFNIEGRHALSAQTMVAIILRSGLVHYFRPVEFDEQKATFEAHRKGEGNKPITLTHTIEMARKAWSKSQDAWEKSGWGRNPTDMLVARATSRLARIVCPDVIAGLYTPEELREVIEAVA